MPVPQKVNWEHLNESSPARKWSFEALLLRGRRKESEVRSQKKYFYKYEMLLSEFSCGTGILPVHKKLIDNGTISQI
ncbi:hypothetical protein Osc7112_3056 [Oscillatoria nigro-viridis PCC 7112]|uniref:Uncharacterized protein n=1 Tax=Phormidium nigroviride PCC 7112 TaxID=179408 RepID=K9VJN6_9CYAN|nr:hypothetical protein [Oscillatoria nigro-viridis]AFZ07450.1 hypothetical protein Osc7112_3056 [Oscillatoria nigro-viridis PCC 7112]